MRTARSRLAVGTVAALASAAALVGGAAAPAGAGTLHYNFTTVDDPADTTFNQALGINSYYNVVGYYGATTNQGWQDTQGTFTTVVPPGAAQDQLTGINDLHTTVGFYVTASGAQKGFALYKGAFITIVPPRAMRGPSAVTQLLGVNDSQDAVGYYMRGGIAHPFEVALQTRTYTYLTGLPANSQATGIASNGDIVGFTQVSPTTTTSFLDQGGTITPIAYPGATSTTAFGVNVRDKVVGSYVDANGTTHGFTVTDPTGTPVYATIDDPSAVGPAGTVVNGINNEGALVGFYTDSSGNVNGFEARY